MQTDSGKKKEDLRIRRTYKLLFDALISLLQERSFDKISITEICDRAMVHRTTFYKHFEDKYHLLKSTIKEFQKVNERSLTKVDLNIPHQYCMEILRNVLRFFEENHSTYAAILANNQNDSIIVMLYQLVAEDIAAKFNNFEKKGFKNTIPKPIITNFHAGGLIALIVWWIRNDMPVTIEAMVNYVDLMVKDENYE